MDMGLWKIFLIYFIVINVIGFFLMGADKRRAQNNEWRISEKTFFLLALIGGSIGTNLGMYAFRHKTKHWYFVIGMPLILIIQVLLGLWQRFR